MVIRSNPELRICKALESSAGLSYFFSKNPEDAAATAQDLHSHFVWLGRLLTLTELRFRINPENEVCMATKVCAYTAGAGTRAKSRI